MLTVNVLGRPESIKRGVSPLGFGSVLLWNMSRTCTKAAGSTEVMRRERWSMECSGSQESFTQEVKPS